MPIAPILALAVLPQDPPPAAEATTSDDETVVVARKWEEDLGDVPGSVSVVDAQQLSDAGATTPAEALSAAPNVLFTEFTSRRLSFPFVRGIGSALGDPAVVTYVDGVPQLGFGGVNLPLVDVARVELLRGPQGALYGRNALGGVLHVVTEEPGTEPEWSARLGFGSEGRQEYGVSYDGPLSDGVLGSFDLSKTGRDGFSTNAVTGNDVDDRDAFFGRGSILLFPDDDSELRVSLFAERARDGGFALNFLSALQAAPHTVTTDFEGVAERDVVQPAMTYTRFGSDVELTSITALNDWDVLETSDFDFTPIDGVVRTTREEQRYLYQELRLASAEDAGIELREDAELRWLLGASAFVSDSERSAVNQFNPGGVGILFAPENVGVDTSRGSFDDVGISLFGQATVALGDDVELGAGLRWERESKEAHLMRTFDPGGFPIPLLDTRLDEDFDEVMPRFSVSYRPSEEVFTWVQASRGFKAGGFNLDAPSGDLVFDAERSWTYEAGVRAELCDGDLALTTTLFHIDWESMQLSLFDPLVGGYVDNVGESTSEGVELEAEWAATDELALFGSVGIVDTEMEQFVDPFGQDTTGNALPFAPEHTVALGGQYTVDLADGDRAYVRAEHRVVDDFFYDAGNLGEESYGLTNVGVGMQRGRWSLDLFVHNLFDEDYVPVAFQPSPVDASLFVGENGAPRLIGFSLTAYL